VDILENQESFLIVADLPGVVESEVNIRLDRGELVLEASRSVQEAGQTLGRECRPHDFRRTFVLPDNVQGDAVSAELERGVLRITIPKTAAARPKRIEVKGLGAQS